MICHVLRIVSLAHLLAMACLPCPSSLGEGVGRVLLCLAAALWSEWMFAPEPVPDERFVSGESL